jgi:alkaline phosphatase
METNIAALAQALVPMSQVNIDGSISNDETHSGEDVALYAIGPGSSAVGGVIEQDRIFDIIMNAYGWSASRD